MEAKTKVRLESLGPYYALFPAATGVDKTVKMGANVSDTVAFIPKVIRNTTWQVERFVRAELAGLSPYKACEKLWYFVKYHIKYEPDARGIEMVRSPRRLIADAKGDCDCGSTFIGSCVASLSTMIDGFKSLTLRITKYKRDYFQHIYPIVTLTDGSQIIMDFVVDNFNYEEPYTAKKDYNMELQYLDGIDDGPAAVSATGSLFGESELAELGKILKKNKGNKSPKPAKKHKEGGHSFLSKISHGLNKFGPLALLRAGLLASMKLNIGKVAKSLRWAYAPRELAQSKGMDMSKYDKVKKVLAKTEKIFYDAGGSANNLKKAILTGNGNRDHAVAGLAGDENTPLKELLGEIYQDEFTNGIAGTETADGLGIVASTAIAAASTAMGALAALIKNIGNLFPKNKAAEGDGSAPAEQAPGDDGNGTTVPDPGPRPEPHQDQPEENAPAQEPAETPAPASDESSAPPDTSDNLPATTPESGVTTSEDQAEPPAETPPDETTEGLMGFGAGIKSFYEKNKKWLVPVGIAAATITTIAIINHYASKPQPQPLVTAQPVNGPPRKRGSGQKGGNRKKSGKKTIIALM